MTCKLISMYLPQFHPIPENDEWWGTGFTEWTNVTKAQPKYRKHYQPHLPSDLGFYDLRLSEAREAQAELAKRYGIHGFCYYHYWFNGKTLLERPFSEVLTSGNPDFPFCLCWANENWTRRWDGREQETLLAQRYSPEDDRAHIRSLLPAFEDPRYIRVEGRPFFAVYRTGHMPEPQRTVEIWREEVRRAGISDLFLARFEAWDKNQSPDPRSLGFDVSVEFAPDWRRTGGQAYSAWKAKLLMRAGVLPQAYCENRFFDYRLMARAMMNRPDPGYPFLRCVTPGFDNSARRKTGASIIEHSSPEEYEAWLGNAIQWSLERRTVPPFVFLNAWNEWAEGNHLEPDARHGRAYLEATLRAVQAFSPG
jgi:lipopolysaccharide biosynthesis protein